jgi:hypothetical protein
VIDGALLGTLAFALACAYGVAMVSRPRLLTPSALMDRILTGAGAGLLIGRLASVLVTDWSALSRPTELIAVRAGVDFWIGAIGGALVLARPTRRDRRSGLLGLADVAPYALVGYGAFQVGCLVRGGCFGPFASVGLVPTGMSHRVFPVELVVGALLAFLGVALRVAGDRRPVMTLAAAVGALALGRLVVGRLTPSVSGSWQRPELESAAVLAAALVIGALDGAKVRRRRRPECPRRITDALDPG